MVCPLVSNNPQVLGDDGSTKRWPCLFFLLRSTDCPCNFMQTLARQQKMRSSHQIFFFPFGLYIPLTFLLSCLLSTGHLFPFSISFFFNRVALSSLDSMHGHSELKLYPIPQLTSSAHSELKRASTQTI